MLEIGAIFGGSFTLALSGALMPGPLLTVTISESARQGFKAGPLLMVGHAILELLLVLALIKGLDSFLRLSPVVGTIALLGGLVLVYLGIEMVRTAGGLTLNTELIDASPGSSRNAVLKGILTSLSNPYWTLWWATAGLGYLVAVTKFGALGIAVFFLGHITADFAWYCLISFGVSRGKSFLKDSSYQAIIKACGILLLCFGGWFLFAARNFLLG
ncbi:MAG: LysE family transporter [Syntrophobacteraceae bacterium]